MQNNIGALKYSEKADGVAYLYRSAFMLAKGNKESGLKFLETALTKVHDKKVTSLLQKKNQQNTLLLAEKVLDEYRRLMRLLPRQDSNLQPSS